MKNSSFYWNWLARVAKASNPHRQAVVKSATSQSPISGKTAILAIATIIAVALTTPTTGPSAEIPELPDLPDPGPVPEPAFPPVPPGTFTCFEYYNAVRLMLENQQANFYQAIERTYNAKCKPFNDAIKRIERQIDFHQRAYISAIDWKMDLYFRLYPNVNDPRLKQLDDLVKKHRKAMHDLRQQIYELVDDLGKIRDWWEKMVKWANEKHRKENEALDAHYGDCLDNEGDDD